MKQFILIFAFCALSLFLTSNVSATTLIVTKTIDSNDGVCDADCSLREAIAATAVSGDTIAFSELFNSAQTITLGGTSLAINKNLTINGNGPQLLKISANQMSRVFDIPVGFTVALSGMTITRGRAVAFVNGINDGGGIYTKGNLTIDNCVVTDNIASLNGAGIYNEGTLLTVTNSTISLNFTPVYAGGGIDGNGAVNVSNSSIINNSGSGIRSFNTVTVSNSLISGNSYGGIRAGSLTVSNSTVGNNFGGIGSGGIECHQLTMTNSTVSGNQADSDAGGISCTEASITNSTISGNKVGTSPYSAGGIHARGSLIVTNSTITNNSSPVGALTASGIFRSSGPVTLRSSIIAGNVDNTNAPAADIGGVSIDFFTSEGYNLIGNIGTITGFNHPGDLVGTSAEPIDPQLDPLDNYGGTTRTHRLRAMSPAIDRGNAFGSLADQRGFARTFDFPDIPNAPLAGFSGKFKRAETIFTMVGDGTDIGAYERSLAGVSGQVTASSGSGLQNTRVFLTDTSGTTLRAVTGSFGYFRFSGVLVGETYTITAAAKGYQFTPYVFTVNSEIKDLNLIGQESFF